MIGRICLDFQYFVLYFLFVCYIYLLFLRRFPLGRRPQHSNVNKTRPFPWKEIPRDIIYTNCRVYKKRKQQLVTCTIIKYGGKN